MKTRTAETRQPLPRQARVARSKAGKRPALPRPEEEEEEDEEEDEEEEQEEEREA